MIDDSLLEQSGETNRIVALLKELKTSHVLKDESLHSGSWMDDQYETDCGPDDMTKDDDNWMDNLDEAA